MASTVLGKRLRDAAEKPDTQSIAQRIKRRTRSSPINDENENPFYLRRASSSQVKEVERDEQKPKVESPGRRKRVSAPRTEPIEKSALSPATKDSHNKGLTGEVSKSIEPTTPQTPRHRDAVSKRLPVTPRHRIQVAAKPLTPRTPQTPCTPSSTCSTVYNVARSLFVRNSNPGQLVGRENERKELSEFVQKRLQSKNGGCVYVSGPPGTGKSALIHEIVEEAKTAGATNSAYLNCMSVKKAADVFEKLGEELCPGSDDQGCSNLDALKTALSKRSNVDGGSNVVVLDEVDHLLTLDLETLYALFEYSMQQDSRLILIGIANALDLTDRFLPRLKARNLKPHLLPFLPYSASQIASIITSRLRSTLPAATTVPADYVPFIHPAAIQLCSKKVSSQTGDLRKAFDICRRAIDLIESETRAKHQRQLFEQNLQASPSKTPLVENINLSSPSSSPDSSDTKAAEDTRRQSTKPTSLLSGLTPETAPRATIAHVARISAAAFGNGASQRLQSLNLQQKAALCALVTIERRARSATTVTNAGLQTPSKTANAAPTVRALFEAYSDLCKRDGMLQPLSSVEFRDVIGSLETLSLISTVDGRGGTLAAAGTPSRRGRPVAFTGIATGDERRVAACVSAKELESAVEGAGAGILKAMLFAEN
ncbi:cell division control protein Cdc6 [Xylona heveae TC161]|uniref:Cell division control protein n=1 Tax=Xylona heveae (strain CBS 132557 / TC161) TaxID=1328760 RepID=A0A165K200_XYLHT|nr:cell division control protein Cdc6 [Xylona heveae TC161]KZF26897.1 cell division control protein Cdc6 [Xylona heveae TC161]